MVEVLKQRFISDLKNENILGKYYGVTLASKRRMPVRQLLKILVYGFFIMLGCSVFLFDRFPFLAWLLILGYLFFTIRLFYKRIKTRFFNSGKPYEAILRNFIYKNNLFTEFSNGELQSEIKMGYMEDTDVLSVIIQKDGGKYQEVSDKLADRLESALGLTFYNKKVTPDYVQYIFRKVPVERFVINQIPLESNDLNLRIYDDNVISLRANYNTLISGASGSGKSFCTYGIMANFASKYVIRNGKKHHAKLYLLDGKMSDIYKFALSSNMPESQYGSTVAEAFKILRKYTEELEKRKEIYTNMEEYDKVLLDLNYEPQLLIIDEYPSLVALMDNKQKKEFENLLGNIARLGRQLSMGLMVIMQQANSESLPTAIKEQLINRIFMGNSESISQQSAEMVFGKSKKDLPSPLYEVGEGLISIDGKEPTAFLSPRFTQEVDKIVIPVLINANENYKEIEELQKKGDFIVPGIVTKEQNWEQFL